MEIKEITSKDWKGVRDIYLALLKNDPDAFADEYNEITKHSEEKWIEDLNKKDGKTFVVIDDGQYIGMGRINFYKELPEIPVLHKLGILPEYRGRGLAKKLVEARENWAKTMGAKKVRLYVIADRQKTIDFSQKNGYKIVQTLKNNIRRNDGNFVDVIIMEKDLNIEK